MLETVFVVVILQLEGVAIFMLGLMAATMVAKEQGALSIYAGVAWLRELLRSIGGLGLSMLHDVDGKVMEARVKTYAPEAADAIVAKFNKADETAAAAVEIKADATAEIKPDATAETKPDAAAEIKAEATAEATAKIEADATAEIKAETTAEIKAETTAEAWHAPLALPEEPAPLF